jgi:hypothetical protein
LGVLQVPLVVPEERALHPMGIVMCWGALREVLHRPKLVVHPESCHLIPLVQCNEGVKQLDGILQLAPFLWRLRDDVGQPKGEKGVDADLQLLHLLSGHHSAASDGPARHDDDSCKNKSEIITKETSS